MSRKTEYYHYYFAVDIFPKKDLVQIGFRLLSWLKKSSAKDLLAKETKEELSNHLDIYNEKTVLTAHCFPAKLFATPGWFQDNFGNHYQDVNFDSNAALLKIQEQLREKIKKEEKSIEEEYQKNPEDNNPWYYQEEHIEMCQSSIDTYQKLLQQSQDEPQKLLTRHSTIKTIGFLLQQQPTTLDLSLLKTQILGFFNQESPTIFDTLGLQVFASNKIEDKIPPELLKFREITQKVTEWNEVYE